MDASRMTSSISVLAVAVSGTPASDGPPAVSGELLRRKRGREQMEQKVGLPLTVELAKCDVLKLAPEEYKNCLRQVAARGKVDIDTYDAETPVVGVEPLYPNGPVDITWGFPTFHLILEKAQWHEIARKVAGSQKEAFWRRVSARPQREETQKKLLNVDLGGGKLDFVDDLFHAYGVGMRNLIIDKFERTAKQNEDATAELIVDGKGQAATGTLFSVLNVLETREVMVEVLNELKTHMMANGTAFISIYEHRHDRSKPDVEVKTDKTKEEAGTPWMQQNKKVSWYVEHVEHQGDTVNTVNIVHEVFDHVVLAEDLWLIAASDDKNNLPEGDQFVYIPRPSWK